MIGSAFDHLCSLVSPKWGLSRAANRASYEQVRSYQAGKLDRTTKNWNAVREAADSTNLAEIQRSRYRAWDLYRNNHHVRKFIRMLTAQTVGMGLRPVSQATDQDGEAHVEFRKKAVEIFTEWEKHPCKERPGEGGMSFGEVQQLLLREIAISGESLIRKVVISETKSRIQGRFLRFCIELIDSDRLAEDSTLRKAKAKVTDEVFRGIQFNARDERVAYWIHPRHPSDPRFWLGSSSPVPVSAKELLHLYTVERIGQMRGVTWLAPMLLQVRDVGDAQYNELVAQATASCVTMAIKRSGAPGAPSQFLAKPTDDAATDVNGNTISTLQPGMIIDLRANAGESIEGFNPSRASTETVNFMLHLLRGAAAALPGIKPSTATGDYANSSFSSERAAENDAWRETEQIQNWFATTACQPIWERVLDIAQMQGMFDGIVTTSEYNAQRSALIGAVWSGPVPRSINPMVDEQAAELAISNGTSSVQAEAASKGRNWRTVLDHQKEVEDYVKEIDLKSFGSVDAPAKPRGNSPSTAGPGGGRLNGNGNGNLNGAANASQAKED